MDGSAKKNFVQLIPFQLVGVLVVIALFAEPFAEKYSKQLQFR